MTRAARAVRRLLFAACLIAPLLGQAPTALAAGGVNVAIRDATLKADGSVSLVVEASGPAVTSTLTTPDFFVKESGKTVGGFSVQPFFSASSAPDVSVAVLIDDSGSTNGQPHADAAAAASSFMHGLPQSVKAAVFAFGATAQQKTDFTTDDTALDAALNGLTVGGETAIYDAISQAATAINQQPGQHNIVLFTDGADTVSHASLNDAITAAKGAKAPISVVGLQTPDLKPDVLSAIASGTGGQSLSVANSGQLSKAFTTIQQAIASQYLINYTSSAGPGKDLDLTVGATVGSETSSDTITVANPRTAAPPSPGQASGPAPVTAPQPLVPALSSKSGLYVGIGAAFLGALLFLYLLLYNPGARSARLVRRTLQLSVRSGIPQTGQKEAAKEADSLAASIAEQAVRLVERLPKPEGYEERLQSRIDRAAWPLRASEFIAIQVSLTVLGFLLGWGLLGHVLWGIPVALLGAFIPTVTLTRAVNKRASAFLEQLPDVLQLLSASLRAGYGLLQAIDVLTKESSPPASIEFARVLAEARLGRPLEEALEAMADRLGTEDFRWVVMAINIQRQVGGNLATVLDNVATTLRDRAFVRRQVKVLSAEGRLSGILLFLLPFGMAGYLTLANRPYIATLFSSWVGDGVVILAGVFMIIGGFWMKKIVNIKI